MAGSVLEMITLLAESAHPVCLSVAQLAPRMASRFITWPHHKSSPPNAPHWRLWGQRLGALTFTLLRG